MRSSWGAILALLAIAAACSPAQVAVAAHARRPSACQRMHAHTKDLSPDRTLVLASRGTDETGNIAACLLPRGKIRRLASWDDALVRDTYAVGATKGFYVLVTYSHSDQYGGTARSLTRFDARSGRGVLLASYACQIQYPATQCPSGSTYGKFVLAANGAGALESGDIAANRWTLASFDPAGTLARLDDAPVDALAITGAEIVWTRAGTEQRAPLPT